MRNVVVVLTLAGILGASAADALLVDLTPAQVEEAIAHGKATYEQFRKERYPVDNLEREYVADLGPNVGHIMLFTEFATIALETRRWLAISRPLATAELVKAAAPVRGTLEFHVVLLGKGRDFMNGYKAAIHEGQREYQPSDWVYLRSVPTGEPGRFLGSARFMFAGKTVAAAGPATFVLRNEAGEEFRADFDLSKLR